LQTKHLSLFQWTSVLWTWPITIPLGIPFAYLFGFFPALIAGPVVCAVNAAERRISWTVQIAAALTALLPLIPRLTQAAPDFVPTRAYACLAATVVCCWLMRRWREWSGFVP
jgi:hypothetical protein